MALHLARGSVSIAFGSVPHSPILTVSSSPLLNVICAHISCQTEGAVCCQLLDSQIAEQSYRDNM